MIDFNPIGKLDIARTMLAAGIDIALIAQMTDLNIVQLEELS